MDDQVLVTFEDSWYVVRDTKTGVVSQGETVESAKRNLQEAIELFFEE